MQLRSRISGEMAVGRLIEGVVAADATRRGDGDPDRFSGSGGVSAVRSATPTHLFVPLSGLEFREVQAIPHLF